jgi:Fe2+ transport system protein B
MAAVENAEIILRGHHVTLERGQNKCCQNFQNNSTQTSKRTEKIQNSVFNGYTALPRLLVIFAIIMTLTCDLGSGSN